jgi:hypothetical protein
MMPWIDVDRGSRYSLPQIPVLVAITNPRPHKAAPSPAVIAPCAARISFQSRHYGPGHYLLGAGRASGLSDIRALARSAAAADTYTFARYTFTLCRLDVAGINPKPLSGRT